MWDIWGRGEVLTEVLVGKRVGKRPPERLRRRWEDNIKGMFRKCGRGPSLC